MIRNVRTLGSADLGGGLVTYPNFFSLQPTQTPNCMDVKFGVGGTIEKRLGTTTINTVVLASTGGTGYSPDSNGTLGTALQSVWLFEEQAGTRFDKFNGNDLTDVNSVGFSAGKIGNAAAFVLANSQSLTRASNASLSAGNINWSAEGWVYLTSNGTIQTFLSKWDEASADQTLREYRVRYRNAPDDRFAFEWATDTAGTSVEVLANTFGSPSTATWYHLYVFHNSANNTAGIAVNAGTMDSSSAVGGNSGSGVLKFGESRGAQYLGGRLDQWGVRKAILTSQNLADLWNAGNGATYNQTATQSGWGAFDFGAGFNGGMPLRHLIVAAGTGIFASSNRGVAFFAIATDRGANYQRFDRAGPYLLAVSETMNRVLYWAGSVGTFMLGMPVGSAPPAKHIVGDFGGFTFLMNHSGGIRQIVYEDTNLVATGPWNRTFSLPSSQDDEITGGIILNKKCYVFTKYKVFRISAVGGNPDFAYQEVKAWGAIAGTVAKATFPDVGEVIVCLGWDRKVRIFDGSEDRVISDAIEQDNGVSPIALSKISIENMHKCHAVVDPLEQVYKLWLVILPSSETVYSINLNLRTGAWYPYGNQSFNAAVMADSGNSRILVGIKRDGFVHWMDTSNRDLTTSIPEYYQSPFYFSRNPKSVTKNQKAELYFTPSSSGTLYYEDRTDWNAAFVLREQFTMSKTSGIVQVNEEIDIPVTSNIYQFQLSDSGSVANPWKLNRADLLGMELGIGKA